MLYDLSKMFNFSKKYKTHKETGKCDQCSGYKNSSYVTELCASADQDERRHARDSLGERLVKDERRRGQK